MALVPIDIPPGIFRNGTEYQTQGRWFSCNLIRWFDGVVQAVGGWGQLTATAGGEVDDVAVSTVLPSKCRTMLTWRSNGGGKWLAVGCSTVLRVSRGDNNWFDITPAGFVPGADDPQLETGYGMGLYGMGLYGTPRDSLTTEIQPLSIWHLDTWGEYLVGCMRGDGGLYEWTLDTVTDAEAIDGAPSGCLGLVVSEQRHLIALGPDGNVRKVQWSDKENNTVWTATDTNEVGGYELQTTGVIQRGVRVRGEVLILTNVDAHVLKYIGYPFIFSRDRVGTECGLIGPNAVSAVESFAVWMGEQGFWIYEGSGVKPLPCEVADYVFSDFNRVMREKTIAAHNGQFGEVWWFYPSSQATEPDRYVMWSYRDKHWAIGELDRTAWADNGVMKYPLAAGSDNHIYQHENGHLASGESRVGEIFLQSGALEAGAGDQIMSVTQILPDEKTSGELQVEFRTRYTPNGTEYEFGPYLVRSDGYTDCRFSGRQIVMRIEPLVDGPWRMGKFRLDGTVSGKR